MLPSRAFLHKMDNWSASRQTANQNATNTNKQENPTWLILFWFPSPLQEETVAWDLMWVLWAAAKKGALTAVICKTDPITSSWFDPK